jgi:probable addiction module antidote protein
VTYSILSFHARNGKLRHLAQAQGIAKVAKAAGIERESLYRALSPRGNPGPSTLVVVTRAIGLRLTVEAA